METEQPTRGWRWEIHLHILVPLLFDSGNGQDSEIFCPSVPFSISGPNTFLFLFIFTKTDYDSTSTLTLLFNKQTRSLVALGIITKPTPGIQGNLEVMMFGLLMVTLHFMISVSFNYGTREILVGLKSEVLNSKDKTMLWSLIKFVL